MCVCYRTPPPVAGSMGGMEVLPEDCSKIKRHIALLCDRIIKGGSLTTAKEVQAGCMHACVCL